MVRTYRPQPLTSRSCTICGSRFRAKRQDARLCSQSCRHRASRYQAGGRVCHQHRVKVAALAELEQISAPVTLAGCKVEEVSRAVAAPIIARYEWLGDVGMAERFFAAFTPAGEVMALVGFTLDRHRLADGGQTACLARGCTTPAAHRHAASWLIGRALRALRKEGVRRVIAYSDPLAGERGVIYAACGFRAVPVKVKALYRLRPPRVRWYEHHRCLSDRGLRRQGRDWSHDDARAAGWTVERIPQRVRWERDL
ncbi:hypothetical protein [Paracoccus sp. (in: a-proteobacteria)]|uniref:Mom family adenine methylcarbamoylation protein n=1 Tax=Paracoccus sp. TaxID=267 RepID=UPI002D803963|nr:hypothetical protein [Paracoccus sp. (in: a-proteobacteria)]